VSPLSAFETLAGKYLGYMIFGGVLAAILTALIVYGLGVPMLGDWRIFAGIIAGLLFSSLGFGFVLSLLAQTESQAVQYSMIFLLTSIFFSGFFLRLDSLWEPIRVVSYMLPVTYAMPLLQNIMLRGSVGNALPLIGLSLLGIAAMVVAWALLRRRIHLGMG
jgi:ABC-2 type transport system permease protein